MSDVSSRSSVPECAALGRFDYTPEAPWLDRFVSRRPIRNYGPLRLYACRRHESGREWPVLVARSGAEAELAQHSLDRLAAAHARLDHPWIARLAERASAGEMEFVVFAEEGVCDLDTLLAFHAQRSWPPFSYAAGEGLALGLLDALVHAHGRGLSLGNLSVGNVLVDAHGACRVFGFDSQGDAARDVAAWAACVRSQRRVFQRPEALARAQRGQPLDRSEAWLAHDVAALENTLCEGSAPLSAHEARSLLCARHARLDVLAPAAAWSEALRVLLAEVQREQRHASVSPGHGERYRFEGPLGTGATGTVFKAWDRQLRQHVAIKRLSAPSGAESVLRLLREVRTLREVRHPQLVRGYELYEDRGQIGAVMEYVPGPTLCEALAAGQLSAEQAREALAQIADAVSDLHRMSILHRDIKPQNVILAPVRGAVLVDFGVAASADRASASITLTLPGQLLGERSYQAPELLAGALASRASDVYALACTACEALGLKPEPNALRGLHEPLRTRLARALAAQPAQRPSALELAAALRAEPNPAIAPALAVALDGRGLTDAQGQHVDLSKRTTLRKVLAALADAQQQRPGSSVSRHALFAAGWPGERIDEGSAANRVYVAVAALRKLGLRGALESDGDGYVLNPRAVRCVP